LNKLRQDFPIRNRSQVDTGKPLDDLEKLQWLRDIDTRYMFAMGRSLPGKADASVVQELLDIAAECQKLLKAGRPSHPFYTDEMLLAKIADVHSTAASACESMRDYPQAQKEYTAAAEKYAALGQHDQAERCRTRLARLKSVQKGGTNEEFERLQAKLAKLPAGSIDHAETLIELAGLHSRNGDDYEGEKLYLQAEQILDKLSGDPSGKDQADALTNSILGIMGGRSPGGPTALEKVVQVRGLYRLLCLELARIYAIYAVAKPDLAHHYRELAHHYREKAAEGDSRKQNDEFSAAMLRALDDKLRNL
jgi:hypothetical protein